MGIEIRLANDSDRVYLQKWLAEKGILRWFPMEGEREVEDSINCWMSYVKQDAVFLATFDGVPCGIANLYLSSVEKLKHQSLFAIIVDQEYRGKGIGTAMLKDLMRRAKDEFKIEILHLEVYEGNPAKRLYERLGFVEYGFHPKFLKEQDGTYLGKHYMQKSL